MLSMTSPVSFQNKASALSTPTPLQDKRDAGAPRPLGLLFRTPLTVHFPLSRSRAYASSAVVSPTTMPCQHGSLQVSSYSQSVLIAERGEAVVGRGARGSREAGVPAGVVVVRLRVVGVAKSSTAFSGVAETKPPRSDPPHAVTMKMTRATALRVCKRTILKSRSYTPAIRRRAGSR